MVCAQWVYLQGRNVGRAPWHRGSVPAERVDAPFPQEAFRGLPATNTHYVTLGYHLGRDLETEVLSAAQHGAFRWFPLAEAIKASEVHRYTWWYLEKILHR